MAEEIVSGLAGGVVLVIAIIAYRATIYALVRGGKMPTPPKDEQIGCQQCGKVFDPNHKPCMCRTCEQVALTKPGSTRLQALDTQVGGDHYKKLGHYQPWEVLQRWLTPEEFRGYMKGDAISYLSREQSKGKRQDIEKAVHVLQAYLAMTTQLDTQPKGPQP